MGHARYIGRVGALAVTLGIGAAIANTPAVAFADTPGSSSSGDNSPKSSTSSTDTSPSTGQPSTTTAGTGGTDTSASDRTTPRRPILRAVVGAIRDIADGRPASGATATTGRHAKQNTTGRETVERTTSTSATATTSRSQARAPKASDDVQKTVERVTQRVEQTIQTITAPKVASTPPSGATTPSPQAVTPAATPAPRQRTSVVTIVTDTLGSVLQPLVSGGSGTPVPQLPTLAAVLVAVRDEIERIVSPRPTQVAYPVGQSQSYPEPVDPKNQHVLVVAIDGTNMSKVLEDDDTPSTNFIKLMNTSTTSAPSIVGHTTISNPSWTAILTGAWDNKTGVINNVYTPTTYDRWPTVFTQLENANPDIRTKAIADWDVIGAIAASGEGADEVVYISQRPDDPTWEKTDKAVTEETVKTLAGANGLYTNEAPNFMVTYLVQVDEAGHLYGGDSEEYDRALYRTDANLGEILKAVEEREKATCAEGGAACEDWTVIVVTDHGHQPQPGFGHGFQSPRETSTFVIADGPQFGDSRFNPDYEIVDVTPTVLSLFGVEQDPRSDGVPLQSLSDRDSRELTATELQNVLQAQLASNDYPNIIVNVALSVRTIVAFLPYYVQGAELPAPLGDVLYVATNVPAQVVAFATGVYGARLFPILPPPPAISFIPDQADSIAAAFQTACGGVGLGAANCVAV